jgi:hypothetical protein
MPIHQSKNSGLKYYTESATPSQFLQIPRSSLVDLPSEVLELAALGVYSLYELDHMKGWGDSLLLITNKNEIYVLTRSGALNGYFADHNLNQRYPSHIWTKNISRAVQLTD